MHAYCLPIGWLLLVLAIVWVTSVPCIVPSVAGPAVVVVPRHLFLPSRFWPFQKVSEASVFWFEKIITRSDTTDRLSFFLTKQNQIQGLNLLVVSFSTKQAPIVSVFLTANQRTGFYRWRESCFWQITRAFSTVEIDFKWCDMRLIHDTTINVECFLVISLFKGHTYLFWPSEPRHKVA